MVARPGHFLGIVVIAILAPAVASAVLGLVFVIRKLRSRASRNRRVGEESQRSSSLPITKGHSRVYRAVNEAEFEQILQTRKFRIGPNSVEGKYFADTLEGAREFGIDLYGEQPFRLVEADVPNNAPSVFRWLNLDGKGPARFLHIDDLEDVEPRPIGG